MTKGLKNLSEKKAVTELKINNVKCMRQLGDIFREKMSQLRDLKKMAQSRDDFVSCNCAIKNNIAQLEHVLHHPIAQENPGYP